MSLTEEERENLVAYLDGELDEDRARAIEARLNADPALRAEVESLRQAWEMLDYLPAAEPSSDFTHRTMERLEVGRPISTMQMPPAPRRWAAPAGWAAALAVTLALGFLLGMSVGPEPPPGPVFTEPDVEEALREDLDLIEDLELYKDVEDLEFLKKLARPELFGGQ